MSFQVVKGYINITQCYQSLLTLNTNKTQHKDNHFSGVLLVSWQCCND